MFKYTLNEKTYLTILQAHNAQELFDLVDGNRDHLKTWLPWLDITNSADDSRGFIKHALQNFAEGKGLTCGIYREGRLAGLISLMNIDHSNHKAEIGYWLGLGFEGNGIMTTATKALVQYAFDELAINRITIRAAEGNVRSRAIPQRLGFREEGRLKDNEWLYDHYVDHVVYGMTVKEWQNH